MRKSARLGIAALIAALLLSAALNAASARILSVSNQNIRAMWSRLEFQSAFFTVTCPVTMEGSFHERTMNKIVVTLMGHITRFAADEAACTNGHVIAGVVPWHISYEGFTGTLPNISSVRYLLRQFLIRIIMITTTCSYGTATDRIILSAARLPGGEIATLQPLAGSNTVNLLEGMSSGITPCPRSGTIVAGSLDGVVTLLNSSTRIRITLI
jgi:hypothetical protein